jgi:hypothetical protein
MLGKIRKFMTLSLEEKKLFVEAWYLLGVMRLALLLFSFKRLTRTFEHMKQVKEKTILSEEELQVAQLIGESITKASAYTPWESACLVQALTAQKMLQKRGIPGLFYFGAKKDQADRDDNITAHAWTQCGEQIITGENGHEAFTVLSVFGWGRE